MAVFPLRLLGLVLLIVAIAIPSCQSLLQRTGSINPRPTFERGLER